MRDSPMVRMNRIARLPGLLLFAILLPAGAATPEYEIRETVLATGFEASEGFDPELSLAGQNGWILYGDGGNGLGSFYEEGEMQAYIGYNPPLTEENEGFASLYHPFALNEFPENAPIVTFRVSMEIVDSTNGERDIFGWTFYNLEEEPAPLFSLQFDNETKLILYALGHKGEPVSTGFTYEHETLYDLVVRVDFSRNSWTANMGESVIARDLPVAGKGTDLSLSSVDAFWHIFTLESPGDNFMIFDDYSITREGPRSPAPRIRIQGLLPGGQSVLSLRGEPGASYHLEASLDLRNWIRIHTGVLSPEGGEDSFVDTNAPLVPTRFYRAIASP